MFGHAPAVASDTICRVLDNPGEQSTDATSRAAAEVAANKTLARLTNEVPGSVQWIAGIVGVALAVTGAVAVFVTNNSTGAASLIAAGGVVGVLAMLANRIQSVQLGQLKLVLTATELTKQAHEEHRAGHPDLALNLQHQADLLLLSAAQPIVSKYRPFGSQFGI
jgi:hypothetical protein